jgi:hypothetical protein
MSFNIFVHEISHSILRVIPMQEQRFVSSSSDESLADIDPLLLFEDGVVEMSEHLHHWLEAHQELVKLIEGCFIFFTEGVIL